MADFCTYREQYSEEQKNLVAQEFRRLQGQYYLEHAGTTLYSEKQLQEITKQLSENLYANPHARNLSSKLTEDAVDVIRFQILNHFKTNPTEYSVIFTSGATAALKLVAENFSYDNEKGDKQGSFVYLQDNHTSVLGMRQYANTMHCVRVDEAFHALSKDLNYIQGKQDCNSLFVYPAQSNFSGVKYPLSWIEHVKKRALSKLTGLDSTNWYVALDAASFVSTDELNLSLIKPDFVSISFYKIFGYPTGVGALLVRNSSAHVLKKKYFGGGTVYMAQTLENTVIFRNAIQERFEDGTVPFLSILALKHGFNTIKRLNINFNIISKHTFMLAQYVYRNLLCFHHCNGTPAVVLYHSTTFENQCDQGGIVNFNLLRDNGEYIGYSEVLHFANLYNIHLRTGCFCNPGACEHFLKLSPKDVQQHFDAGHVCGDQHDLVNGYPTGSIRVSFGYMSTKEDADKLIEMIEDCFIVKPLIKKIPERYELWQKKYNDNFNRSENNKWITNSRLRNQSEPMLCFNDPLTIAKNFYINGQDCDDGILQQIVLYPIKSCGGFPVLTKWPITSTGLKYDRQWMVINSSGVCVTQKHNKKMCLVRPIIDLATKTLILTYPGHKKIQVSIDVCSTNYQNGASLCQSKVCGDKIQGWDCGDEVADWFAEILDCPGLRLLKQCSGTETIIRRTSSKNEQLQLSLANKAQYLLINTASVMWLREKIAEDEFSEALETTIQRFRPNFVVKFSNPFVENSYKDFVFDNTRFETGGVCTRCQMICIDQSSAKASKEPLQTLSKVFKGKISFGVYLNKFEDISDDCLHVGCKVMGVRT